MTAACSCPNCGTRRQRGCWYGTMRWRHTSQAVLRRDRGMCYVVNCPEPGVHADHIEPVHPGMSAHLFHAMSNLRASCRRHNTARGVAARLERELEHGVAVIEPMRARPFLKGRYRNETPPVPFLSPKRRTA